MRTTKRIVSLLLAMVLLLGAFPFSALAADEVQETADSQPIAAEELPEEAPGEDTEKAASPTETQLPTEAEQDASDTDPAQEATTTPEGAGTEPATTEAGVTEPESTEAPSTEVPTEEPAETEAPEAPITEPEETEAEKAAEALMKAASRAVHNGLYTWQDHILNYDKYYTFPNGGHVYGMPRLDYNGAPAFCIEPGVTAANGVNTVRNYSYAIQKLGANGDKKYAAITLALAYGWPNTSYATSNTGYVSHFTGADNATYREMETYAATQIIIWEIALGYRSYNAPYARTDGGAFFNRYYTTLWGEHWDNLKSVYDQIVAKMAQHNNLPSFTTGFPGTAPTYKLDYNAAAEMYTKTLTDTNGALSGFNITSNISGVTFTKSGNTLTITATPAGAQALQNGATCTLQNDKLLSVDPSTAALVYGNSGSQTIILPNRFDPARAYFKLEAEAFGSAKVIKISDNGKVDGFQFTLWQGSTKLETVSTGATGIAVFTTNLTPGTTYTVKEATVRGYEIQPDQTFTAQAGKTTEITFSNKTINTVQVVKTSEDGVIAGRTFRLLDENKRELEAKTTDQSGKAVFTTKLTLGKTYWIAEDNAIGYAHQEAKSFKAANGLNTVSFENVLKKWTLTVTKKDTETGAAQGEAKLGGAVYGIYDGETLVDTYTTDNSGKFTTKAYVCGDNWSVKEITPPTGYTLNTKSCHIGAEEGNYTLELNSVAMDVTDSVIRGKLEIIKTTQEGLDKHEIAEDGAQFQVFLASAGSYDKAKETERDVLTTDKDGHAASKSLPYGTYTVHQVSGWEGRDFVADFTVTISENGKTYTYALLNPTQYYPLRVVKVDSETGKPVAYAQTGFRIYGPDGKQIKMTVSGYTIDTFYTDETGSFITPLELPYGKGYSLVEVQAPQGYVLDSTPVKFDVTRNNAQDHVIRIVRENVPQKGVITIEKTGEVFSSVIVTGGGYVDEDGKDIVLPNLYQPVYEVKGLPGATFEIIAAQDIMTQDGTVRYTEGQVVGTITTGEDGKAVSEPLYLGSYVIKEIKAPIGSVLDSTEYNVVLEYAGQNESLVTESVSVNDLRQKAVIDLSKVLEQDEIFGIGNKGEIENVKFGLYARNEITALDGTSIPAGGLLEIGSCSENGKLTFHADLPLGRYYVAELATDEHYVLDETQYDLEFVHDEATAVAHISVPEISNTLIRGDLLGHKQDRETKEAVSGAVFGLFRENETVFTEENAIFTAMTDENGEFRFDNLAFGSYVVRELSPAEGFLPNEESYPVTISKDEEVVEFTVDNDRIPELHTTATSEGEKETFATSKVVIEDVVSYKHLIPGKPYTLHGTITDRSTGEPFLVNGEKVVAELPFVPEKPTGSVTVLFEFDGTGITEQTQLVVFEDLYCDGVEIATHTDIHDDGQTVTLMPPPKPDVPQTGDESHLGFWIGLCSLSVGGLISCAVLYFKKKKGDE